MDGFYITIDEILIIFFLTLTLIFPFKLLNKNNKLSFAHPLIIHSVIMIYYTVLTPVYQVIINATDDRGFNFREQYILGWKGAFLSAISILIGYSFKTKLKKNLTKYCNLNYKSLWFIGLILNIIGVLSFLIYEGFDLSKFNPFYNESASIDFLRYGGNLVYYLSNCHNFLISGTFLMFASSYSTKKNFPITFLSLIISIGSFLNAGFRFRVLFLLISILLFILIKDEKVKPSMALKYGSFSIIFVVILMTIVGEIRTYGSGFNFENLTLNDRNFILNILDQPEGSVFTTTSGIINLIPETLPFENFRPITKALMHPLPSAFFDKDSGDYFKNIIDGVYGFKNIWKGAAYMNFGEYYLMFGWFGIFIFNFLLGNIFKRLWVWINIHKEEPLALIIYILNVIYIFMIVSRGYLPQQFQLYVFIVSPVIIIYFCNLKRSFNNNL